MRILLVILMSLLVVNTTYAGRLREIADQIWSEELQKHDTVNLVVEAFKMEHYLRNYAQDPVRAAIYYAHRGPPCYAKLIAIENTHDPNYFAKMDYYADIILAARRKHNPDKIRRYRCQISVDELGTFTPDPSDPLPQPVDDYLKYLAGKSKENDDDQPLMSVQDDTPPSLPSDPPSAETQYGSTPTQGLGTSHSSYGRDMDHSLPLSTRILFDPAPTKPRLSVLPFDPLDPPLPPQAPNTISDDPISADINTNDTSPPSISTTPDRFTHPVNMKAIVAVSMNDACKVDSVTLDARQVSILNNFANSAYSNFVRLSQDKNSGLVDWASSLLIIKSSATVQTHQQTALSIPKPSHVQQTLVDDKTSTVIRSSTEPVIPQDFPSLPIKSIVVKNVIQVLAIIAYMTLGLIFYKVQLNTTVIGAVRRSIIYNNLSKDLKALYDESIAIGQACRSLTLRPMVLQFYKYQR